MVPWSSDARSSEKVSPDLNLLICWPPTEARSHLFLALDPLQKQGLGHALFFDSLQKQSHSYLNLLLLTLCRSKVTFVFATWPPAEARSWPSFIFWLPVEAKSQLFNLLMFTPCRSKVTFVFGTWSPAEARSWPSFIFRLPTEAKSKSFKFVNVDPLQK